MVKKQATISTVNGHLDELERIVGLIEERCSAVRDVKEQQYVRRLLQQVRHHLGEIEQLEAEEQ